jgi:hypothetical protein
MVLSGDTSGAVTVTVPAVAGTNTITLPAATGTVLVSGNQPAFSAYSNANQSIANLTFVKISFQVEEFDTANCFDSTTNYRFTPTVAGYYQVTGQAVITNNAVGSVLISIYKNGSRFKDGSGYQNSAGIASEAMVSSLIYFNGSTDYVELYALQNSGITLNILTNAPFGTYFQASMIRAA